MTTAPPQHHIVRSRISKEMAYPIGFEFLRAQFGGIPEWQGARFWFTAPPTTFASEFARILLAHEPYCILRIERRYETHVPDYLPAGWSFTVYPVQRTLKSHARGAICFGALAPLKDFVARVPTHANYYNRCEAIFDPVASTCTTQLLWEI